MPERGLGVADFSEFIVEQIRILHVHEFGVAAPVGSDHGQTHHHCLMLRPAPAFSAAWSDKTIHRFVEPWKIES
jgi:hypothetical protein